MRTRTNKLPDSNSGYVNTTYFDEKHKYLDLGYQLLKCINNSYSEFRIIKKLFINNNQLSKLPDCKDLPNLEYLDCSYNLLTEIPFYPKLTFLKISNNKIKSCSKYSQSKINHFDCGFNYDFNINLSLPLCQHLYMNNINCTSFDISLFPNLQYLDCENNNLSLISKSDVIIELNINSNKITYLPTFPNITHLMAEKNLIATIPTFPKIKYLNVSFNQITSIYPQPCLEKIIANNNFINKIGYMPLLELADLSYNLLLSYKIPSSSQYISLHFNPIKILELDKSNLNCIKELQVNFDTYSYIYNNYYDKITNVNIEINHEIIDSEIKKYKYNQKISNTISQTIKKLDFRYRFDIIKKISSYISKKYDLSDHDILYNNIINIYNKSIVVTIYFNNYMM